MSDTSLQKTPLHALHLELGAKMVPFAGYDMPVSYPEGILAEHRHCRESAALFDVSHMGQVRLSGDDAAAALESLVPVDVAGLAPGRQRYAFFTNAAGGILDDLMITRRETDFLVIVNAGCKDADIRHLQTNIAHRCSVQPLPERALLALQGPKAAEAIGRLAPELRSLVFMTGAFCRIAGIECFATRSGYTGEDGYEIMVPEAEAVSFWNRLVAAGVKPCGLGARDTLRLEAGMNLYGQDMDETVSPWEAALAWTLALEPAERDFIGRDALIAQKAGGAAREMIGLVLDDKGVLRHGQRVVTDRGDGEILSGSFSPTLGKSIAFARVPAGAAGGALAVDIRGKALPVRAVKFPFVRDGQPCAGI